jgi:hypothetical protein
VEPQLFACREPDLDPFLTFNGMEKSDGKEKKNQKRDDCMGNIAASNIKTKGKIF